ncbi:hypothetical protein AMATHDRAFT_72835 [Amanita thiersii Skay4041]|uniref:Uncharacterized protein n=1 Tax=Amanita thiersii Skay4041 TaxID=703135 RepID=A0A2A9P178_9AGAR|nr:hypothetical protein AMATHDRAFT_72835 [Amanita thiersii Skay4041]
MDTFSFGSLAHVRILLVPVGSISQATFDAYAVEIRSFEAIRLGDIPADAKDERGRFMPNPLSSGHLLLSFPTHPPPHSHHPLTLFRPSHFPLAVIGIAVCSQAESLDSLDSIYAQFHDSLVDMFPPRSIFPLAKNCFVYDESDGTTNPNLTENLPGLVVIPNVMGNKKLYIGTLLADLCSIILGELSLVVQVLESPIGNEHLNSSLLPLPPPPSELPHRLDSSSSGTSQLPSHHSFPDLSRNNVLLGPAPTAKRSASGSAFRQSTINVPTAKKRMSTIGVASSHGRLFKVLGDLFLLSGRIEDASVWYTEALQSLKTSQDSAWHASALEGMSTISVVEAWTAGHGLHSSTSSSKDPWTDISERLAQATSLYQRSAITEGEQNYALLSYLYSSCVLRHAFLFFSIWSAKGWGPLAFTTMLQSGPVPYLPPTLSHEESSGWDNLERLSTMSGITRSFISSIITQAHGPWLLHLDPRERISVLEAIAGIYACLGYKRKEAYILREILGCIMDLIVCGREEDGLSRPTNVPGINGLGIQGVNTGGGIGDATVGVRFSESDEGNISVLRLLRYICRVLGVDLEAVKLVNLADEAADTVDPFFADAELESGYHELRGWPELQIGVVREAVAVAEALPDFPAVAQFSLSSLKVLLPILTPPDQIHLYSTSVRALSTARRRGDTKCVEYWSGRPIVNVVVAPLPLSRVSVEKPLSALRPRTSDVTPILTGVSDPFLYNPRKAARGNNNFFVAQNEILEFAVTLHNPYVFDLELQSVSLSTSGVQFHSQPTKVVIPGCSFHQIVLAGTPVSIGTLVVRGCIVQAPGGSSREFILPLLTPEEEERLAHQRSVMTCELDRHKYSGLDCLPWKRTKKRASAGKQVVSRFLECNVIPEQPLLRIRRTSVTHGAVMLYDGERTSIRLTIENVSHLPIDFVRLVFDDSTIAPAQQALADGELSVFDTYETEYSLIHRPFFSGIKVDSICVAPGQCHTLTVQCFGKVGCTKGTVHISYAYAHRPESEATNLFYTRQLSYSMMVTVYQMLECHAMDILPFPSYSVTRNGHVEEEDILYVHEPGWCYFSIDVRNTYGSPFEVILERLDESTNQNSTSTILPPGAMSRLVIPIKKFSLPSEQLSKAIPTLSDRQFVVAKSSLSSTEEQLQRELFWYREVLFKVVRGRWRELGGTRFGELSLRQQRITLSMLDALRLETARLSLALTNPQGNGSGNKRPNIFLRLKAKIQNLSPSPAVFVIDFRLEPSEHVIYEGTLQDVPVGRLVSGDSKDVEVVICFLALGNYEIFAEAKLAGDQGATKAGVGYLKVKV